MSSLSRVRRRSRPNTRKQVSREIIDAAVCIARFSACQGYTRCNCGISARATVARAEAIAIETTIVPTTRMLPEETANRDPS